MLAHDMESYLRALRQRETRADRTPGVDALIGGVDALERVDRGAARQPAPRRRSVPPCAPSPRSSLRPSTAVAGGGPERGAGAGGAARAVARDVRAVGRAARARHQRRHASGRACASAGRSSRGAEGHSARASRSSSGSPAISTTRRSRLARRRASTAAPIGRRPPIVRGRRAGPRRARGSARPSAAVALRARRPDAARRADADDRRPGHQPRAARRRAGRGSSRACRRSSGARCRRTAQAIERQLRDLREGVMRVRLVPVGEIFRRMPFVVRDLARDIGNERAARAPRAGNRDRQVPDRADDGSGPAPGAQRGQPRHRAAGGAAAPPASREEGTLTLARRQRRRHGRCSRSPTTAAASTRRRSRRAPAALGLAGARRAARRRDAARSDLRARVSRRATRPIAPAAAASAWPWCKTTVAGAGRDAGARHGAGRGHALHHRAAADAGDHRRADRARRRPRRSRCRSRRSAK